MRGEFDVGMFLIARKHRLEVGRSSPGKGCDTKQAWSTCNWLDKAGGRNAVLRKHCVTKRENI